MQELKDLVAGYKEFCSKERQAGQYRHSELAAGQSPGTMVISCCDSRVSPSLIFNEQPGELFTVRNVANLVPPYEEDGTYHGTSAALEFAVLGLGVAHVVVMGHSQCGGIQACAESHKTEKQDHVFINKWLSMLESVTEQVLDEHADASTEEQCHALELASIRTSLENLKTFPFVTERIANGTLTIDGVYFDIEDGQLYVLDQNSGEFKKVD